MTTSPHQRMRRISPNNPVRRRLVFDDAQDQARNDNFTNILQESLKRERKEKTKKWNFDFATETALKGRYIWYEKVGDHFVEMNHKDGEDSPSQSDNENTPVHGRNMSVPEVRKRKIEVEKRSNHLVKRRVDF